MGYGNNTTTSTQAPPAQYSQAYNSLLQQASQTASQPLQQYQGNLVAPLTQDQQTAFGTVAGTQSSYQPYLTSAQSDLSAATTPLWSNVQQFSPQAVSQYESPYTQQVVNSTEQQFNNQNAQQFNQANGSAAAAGAFGGDRSAVLAAQIAGQQQANEAPVIAGLENQGYTQGLGEFNTQQQNQLSANEANAYLNSQAGFGEMNLGTEATNLPLQQASAQLQTGALQQQQQQEQLNVPYEQYVQQQAYPFQTESWLSGIDTGLGSVAGGTSTTSTPAPSPLSQIAGLGIAGLSFLRRGGKVVPFRKRDAGGMIPGGEVSISGMVPDIDSSFIPNVSSSHGSSLPKAPSGGQAQQSSASTLAPVQAGINFLNKSASSPADGVEQVAVTPNPMTMLGGSGGILDTGETNFGGALESLGAQGLNFLGLRRGGNIRRYAGGGNTSLDDESVPAGSGMQTASPSPPPPVGMVPANTNTYGLTAPTPITLAPQKPDWHNALLAAGLSIAGGTSHNALENIGRGAETGLQEYQSEKINNQNMAEKQAGVQEENQKNTLSYEDAVNRAKQLADDMDFRRTNMTREQQNQDRQFQQEQHNQDLQRQYQGADLGLRQQELKFNEGLMGGMGSAPIGANGQQVHGDAYLASLPTNIQPIVKGIAEGRIAPPTSFAMSKPYWQGVIQAVSQYDPSFDQTTWPGRVKTRTSFTGGPDAANVTAINTALQHAGVVQNALTALDNTGVPAWNSVKNYFSQEMGNAAPTNARESIDALASEGRKIFAGTGGGNLTELENWQKNFPINGSPDQQKGALSQFVSLVDSRLDALADKYNRGMGKAEDKLNFLTPHARQVYQQLTGRQPQTDAGGAPSIPPAAASYLKAHPETRAHFDSTFGAGSSASILGQ